MAAYAFLGTDHALAPGVGAGLANDGLLPIQFRELRKPKSSGLNRLLVGVLQQAMEDYDVPSGYKVKKPRVRAKVRAWIGSNKAQCLFDFVPLCDALDLDVTSTRAHLLRQLDDMDAGGRLNDRWDFFCVSGGQNRAIAAQEAA
jgi:hypothetical protein